jgi:hypothetical protein
MKIFLFVPLLLTLVSSQVFAGGDCASKTAAFTTKINKALELASLDSETVQRINKLTSDCHFEYNVGMSTYQTNSCKEALDLLGIN